MLPKKRRHGPVIHARKKAKGRKIKIKAQADVRLRTEGGSGVPRAQPLGSHLAQDPVHRFRLVEPVLGLGHVLGRHAPLRQVDVPGERR